MLVLDIQWPDSIASAETRLRHVSTGQDRVFTGSCPINRVLPRGPRRHAGESKGGRK